MAPRLLATLALLAVLAADDCDKETEECVPQSSCKEFMESKEAWRNMAKGTEVYKEALQELKSSVCEKETQRVCCIDRRKEGAECETSRGEGGSCRPSSLCRGSPVYSSSLTCGQLTCCPQWAQREAPPVAVRENLGKFTAPKVNTHALCGLGGSVNYVFGGQKAEEGQFPFMASLVWSSRRTRKVQSFCGGVLITNRHVLTAAHCFNSVSKKDLESEAVDVRIGLANLLQLEKPGNSAKIANVKIHENFRKHGVGVRDDIAILTLDRDVHEGTVCLPDEYRSFRNQTAVVAGWGRTNKGASGESVLDLMFAELEEVEVHECQRKYDSFLRNNRKKARLTRKQLCAGNDQADACAGDSGGPLLHLNSGGRWMVAGIVSFGPSSCAGRVPGVYTKVASYLAWIKENTGL